MVGGDVGPGLVGLYLKSTPAGECLLSQGIG